MIFSSLRMPSGGSTRISERSFPLRSHQRGPDNGNTWNSRYMGNLGLGYVSIISVNRQEFITDMNFNLAKVLAQALLLLRSNILISKEDNRPLSN
jgi:hypothetical protein